MLLDDVPPPPKARPQIGWREYVSLKELGIGRVKAKVDTGARTSALHAINIRFSQKHGVTWVHFDVHPLQRNTKQLISCEAPLVEERMVRDSGGKSTLRPVIETLVTVCGKDLYVELTLVSRGTMGFRMLIGRQAIRGEFLVNAGRSYLGGRPRRKPAKTVPSGKVPG